MKKQKYNLLRYDKLQDISSGSYGEIVKSGANCDGFLEEIFASDLSKYRWEIQVDDGGAIMSYPFNAFQSERIDNIRNEKVFTHVKNIIEAIESIQNERIGAEKEKSKLNVDRN